MQEWQDIFGLRYMSSNMHSLLHLHESVASMGPLYMYSTFNFEGKLILWIRFAMNSRLILRWWDDDLGIRPNLPTDTLRILFSSAIGHDLVTMTHGTTQYGQQLISSLLYYRQSIIETTKPEYPLKLFHLNERILCRKSRMNNSTRVEKLAQCNSYIEEVEYLKMISCRTFLFFEQLIIRNIAYRTFRSVRSTKFSNCCVSFTFGSQVKLGFIRAIVRDAQDEDRIYVLLEELIDNERARIDASLQVKINNNQVSYIPNIYIRTRSHSFILRSSSCLSRKHSYRILANEETVEIIEYCSLKESSWSLLGCLRAIE